MRGEPGNKAKSQTFTVLYCSSCAKPSKIYACENLQCSWTAWLAYYCSCFPASFKQFGLNFIRSQVWYERPFTEIFTLKINKCVCTVVTYNTIVMDLFGKVSGFWGYSFLGGIMSVWCPWRSFSTVSFPDPSLVWYMHCILYPGSWNETTLSRYLLAEMLYS